jgi:hypothetical protein
MSANEGIRPDAAHTHDEAGEHRIEHVLRGYGVLSREKLAELCGTRVAHCGWDFDVALNAAVRQGRVRELGGGLFEVPPEH